MELRAPGGSESGLKLVSGFTVTQDQATNIVVDWDLRKALTDPTGQPGMHLRPCVAGDGHGVIRHAQRNCGYSVDRG